MKHTMRHLARLEIKLKTTSPLRMSSREFLQNRLMIQ